MAATTYVIMGETQREAETGRHTGQSPDKEEQIGAGLLYIGMLTIDSDKHLGQR